MQKLALECKTMRPEILFPLFQDVIALPGIGPRLAALLAKAAGPRVKDVLFQLPTGLVDRSQTTSIAEAPDGEITTLTAKVEEHIPSSRQGKPYKVRLYDGTAFMHLVYFHSRRERESSPAVPNASAQKSRWCIPIW